MIRTIPASERRREMGVSVIDYDKNTFLKVTALSFANGGEWLVSDIYVYRTVGREEVFAIKRVKASTTMQSCYHDINYA